MTESKIKLEVTRETENYSVIHSGGQLGVMMWIYKTLRYKFAYYKFWNDRNYRNKTKTHRGHLTILGVYAPTEGRKE